MVGDIDLYQDCSEFEAAGRLGPFYVKFACSPSDCVNILWVFQPPDTGHEHAW